ncbi:MAG: protease synthase and sporulation negative regulatory protein 2 [Akkermansiaceae bacterium]|nr:protease synthase and sporulation negative regulatory protein 2 [Akkermansiaceae bacterium]
MYTPAAFRVESPERLADFMRSNSFATLVSHDGASSVATHIPVLFDAERGLHGALRTHMARANPQWRHFVDGREVLVIFQGPHAYISASLYETDEAVSTWNYTAVHVYGVPVLIDDADQLAGLIDDTVDAYDPTFPKPSSGYLPEKLRAGLMKALVGFEIPISRIEGKFKLSQNRDARDIRNVYEALAKSASHGDRELAEMMAAEGIVPPSADGAEFPS